MRNGFKIGIRLTQPATAGIGVSNLRLADGVANLLLAGTTTEVLLLAV